MLVEENQPSKLFWHQEIFFINYNSKNPCFIYGDNQSVLWNTSVPESSLKKKSSSVAYHFVREGVSSDEWRTTYLKSSENPSDILTKPLPSGLNRYKKVRMVLYDIYPETTREVR